MTLTYDTAEAVEAVLPLIVMPREARDWSDEERTVYAPWASSHSHRKAHQEASRVRAERAIVAAAPLLVAAGLRAAAEDLADQHDGDLHPVTMCFEQAIETLRAMADELDPPTGSTL